MAKLKLIFENESKTDKTDIEFELYDAPVVHRVKQLLQLTKADSFLASRIDVRKKTNGHKTIEYATEMNNVINSVNTLNEGCVIQNDLLLDLTVAPHEQVQKLNRLHEIFQLYTEKYGVGCNQTQELLERVNILVHLMEASHVEIDQVFIVAKQEGALHKYTQVDLDLTDEDHMLRMPHALWGVLEMDYATVGKDLGACFWTNDVDLVKSGELRQQLSINPGVAANFMTGPSHAPTYDSDASKIADFYSWCEGNNLGDYIDYTLPKYRLGRLRLGQISQAYTMDDIHDIGISYPEIKEIQVY